MFKFLQDRFRGSDKASRKPTTSESADQAPKLQDPLLHGVEPAEAKTRDKLSKRIQKAYEVEGRKRTIQSLDPTPSRTSFRKAGLSRFDQLAAEARHKIHPSHQILSKDNAPIVRRETLSHGTTGIYTRNHGDYLDLGKYDPMRNKGSFKRFNQGINLQTGERVALLKAIGRKGQDDLEFDDMLREKMGDLPKLVERGKLVSKNLMVQKLYAGTMKDHERLLPKTKDKIRFAIDVMRGLVGMHEAGWVHRDIKPDNLLIDDKGRGVVGDLGLARKQATTVGGTPNYMHPKMLRDMTDPNSDLTEQGKKRGWDFIEEAQQYDTYALGMTLGTLFGDVDSVANLKHLGGIAWDVEGATGEFKGIPLAKRAGVIRDFIATEKKDQKKQFQQSKGRWYESKPDTPQRIALEMRNLDRAKIATMQEYLKRLEALRDRYKDE